MDLKTLKDFQDDSLEGFNSVSLLDGTVFHGEIINGKINGKGKLILNNGGEFEGDFVNGEIKGKGKLSLQYGETYIGKFKDGKLNGKGTWRNNSGATYSGFFKNSLFNGRGTLSYPNETHYIGDFKKGKYHGKGIYNNVIGVHYEGDFKDGKFHGYGELDSPDGGGLIYIGEFNEGEFHGKGSLNYTWTRSKFEGEFIHGNYKNGRLESEDGDIYVGEFLGKCFNGNGKLKSRKGYEYSGEFKNGMFFRYGSLKFHYQSFYVFFEDGKNLNPPFIPDHLMDLVNKKYYQEKKELYYLIIDTETTGLPLDWNADVSDLENWPRLVQLAYIGLDINGNEVAKEDYIIMPIGFKIPLAATEIHGISNQKAENDGEPLDTVLNKFSSLIEMATYIVSHNISFDEKIIGAEFLRNGMQNFLEKRKKICTMIESTGFCSIESSSGYKWPSLVELNFKLFHEEIDEIHNAAYDVEIAAKCFWELRKKKIINL